MHLPIRPEDVVNRMFPTTRLRAGYECEAVDLFLDSVAAAMRARRPLREMITGVEFPTGRPGYVPTEIDAFLDELLAQDETVEHPEPELELPERSPWVLGD